MRLFIGIVLTSEVKSHLIEIQYQLAKAGAIGSLMRIENMHITLEFIGEVPANRVSEIKEAIDNTASNHHPFSLFTMNTNAFIRKQKAHTIWCGISGELNKLEALQGELHRLLIERNFNLQERIYKPHITLFSRVKSSPDTFICPKQIEFQVDRICLFESTHKDGLLYYPTVYQKTLLE